MTLGVESVHSEALAMQAAVSSTCGGMGGEEMLRLVCERENLGLPLRLQDHPQCCFGPTWSRFQAGQPLALVPAQG